MVSSCKKNKKDHSKETIRTGQKQKKYKKESTDKKKLLTALKLTESANSNDLLNFSNVNAPEQPRHSTKRDEYSFIADSTIEGPLSPSPPNYHYLTSSPKLTSNRFNELIKNDLISPIFAAINPTTPSSKSQANIRHTTKVNKPVEAYKGVRVSRKKRKRITMKPSPRRPTASQKRKTRKSVTGNLKKWEEKRKKNKAPRELPSFAINRLSISSFSLPTDGTIFPTPKKKQEETKSLKTKAIKKAGPHIPLDILATKDVIL